MPTHFVQLAKVRLWNFLLHPVFSLLPAGQSGNTRRSKKFHIQQFVTKSPGIATLSSWQKYSSSMYPHFVQLANVRIWNFLLCPLVFQLCPTCQSENVEFLTQSHSLHVFPLFSWPKCDSVICYQLVCTLSSWPKEVSKNQ